MELYPLKFTPKLVEKVWGGHWLAEHLGRKASDEGELLGESWETFSGSTVTNGSLAGRKLGDLYQENGPALAGEIARKYPQFPLLVKFIDARENLSVQVHPNDALAQKLENYRFGKSEMWYIVQAEAGARILYGLSDKATSLDQIGAAFKSEAILPYLKSMPVQAGDIVYLPSGTVHALCEGIVVYELQQESDITYRLYDWGRQGREMHYEKGLQAINLEARNLTISHPTPAAQGSVTLVECPYFSCELLEISDQLERPANNQSFTLLTTLSGAGRIVSPTNSFSPETLGAGDSLLIPASLPYLLKADQPLRILAGQAR